MKPAGDLREERRALRLLQLVALVSTLDRFAMPPMLIAIAADLGVPLAHVVQAAGAYFLAYGLLQPMWGMVSDRLGIVRTLRIALLLAALATALSAAADSTLALGVSRSLAGACFGAAFPAALIYLGDTVPAERRQRSITSLMVGVATGTASASVAAGVVADLLSWRLAFLTTGLGALVLTLALVRLREPTVTREHRGIVAPLLAVARSRATVLVLLLAFTEGAVLLGTLTLLPPAVEESGVSASVAGTVTATYGVSVFVFAGVVGRLSGTWHPARLIALGGAAAFAATMILAFSTAPAAAVVGAVLLGVAWTGMHSSLQTWATEVLPGARATVVSLFAGSLFAGSAAAAIALSGLADAGRYRDVFLIAAATSVPLAAGATWGRAGWRRPRGPGA